MGFSSKSLELGVKKTQKAGLCVTRKNHHLEKSTQLIQLTKGKKNTETPAAWLFDLGGFRPVFQGALCQLCVCEYKKKDYCVSYGQCQPKINKTPVYILAVPNLERSGMEWNALRASSFHTILAVFECLDSL